jgi:hypothetical protein
MSQINATQEIQNHIMNESLKLYLDVCSEYYSLPQGYTDFPLERSKHDVIIASSAISNHLCWWFVMIIAIILWTEQYVHH